MEYGHDSEPIRSIPTYLLLLLLSFSLHGASDLFYTYAKVSKVVRLPGLEVCICDA